MSQSYVASDLFIQGNLACKSFAPPAGCVTDAAVEANAGIEATKVVHQYSLPYSQAAGVAAVSETRLIHQVFAAGSQVSQLAGFLASIVTPPTGSDTITIDLQRSTAGGAFSTVLAAVITFGASTVARTPASASFALTELNNDDLLQVVVTKTGTSGQGIIAQAFVRENPQ